MEYIFEIKLGKVRKLTFNLLFRSKQYIFVFIFMGLTFAFFICCLIAGYLLDNDAFRLAFSALSLFIVSIIGFLIGIYIVLFVKIKGKNSDIMVFKYEFINSDCVIISDQKNNNTFALNKNNIKEHYILYDTLIIRANFIFIFPNNEKIKKELNLSDI